MKPGRIAAVLAAVIGLAALLPAEASGVPVFARKYGVNCTMCHSAFPRLNDFGVRYRANGYRLPGRESIEKTVLESPAPVALRTSVAYTYVNQKFVPGGTAGVKTNGVALAGLDLLSAGLLGPRIGYLMVYVPGITEGRGVTGQEAALEMASVVFSGIAGGSVGLRVGRFEPAYTAFSVKRQLSVSPYEIYDYSFPGGPAYSETQTGLEVRGGGYGPARIAAGLLTGSQTNRSDDPPRDAYVRLEGLLGAGEGQTAGQRLGVTGYLGWARPAASEVVLLPDKALESFTRLGVDASLNAAGCNLALQALWGRDAGPLWSEAERITWWGGFAELSYTSAISAVGFARFDMVKEPSFIDRDIRRITVGGRYYFEDNVAAHLEFSHQVLASSAVADDPKEDFLTARVDFAF